MSITHEIIGASQCKGLVATTTKTTIFTVPTNCRAMLQSIHIDTGSPTASITMGVELGELGAFTEFDALQAYDVGANGRERIDLDGIVLNTGADVNITASANNGAVVILTYTIISRSNV